MLYLNYYGDKKLKLFYCALVFCSSLFSISNVCAQKNDVIVFPLKNVDLSPSFDFMQVKLLELRFGLAFKCSSFFSHLSEESLLWLSALKAKLVFLNAYDRVPAYRAFVDEFSKNFPRKFWHVPITNKYNYIKRYPVVETLVDGKMPLFGQIDTSTGTTGKATSWVRGQQEMENLKYWLDIASRAVIGKKSYIFCNMFALGPWVSGMSCAVSLIGKQVVVNIGPKCELFYDQLRLFGKEQSYVIGGYPTHMKVLVENSPIDLSEYDITMVVGGEALTENVHDYLLKSGIKAVFSSYGASDLRINLGQNTEFEQELQRICRKDPDFKKELLGDTSAVPSFFRYNPLLDYIEETADERLIFTDLDLSRVSPRVRYDLGDKGKVFAMSKIVKLLKKYGYKLKPKINFPILCLYGRGDEAVIFNGSNIMYDDLGQALKDVSFLQGKIHRYAFNKFENKEFNQQLELWIELKKDQTLTNLGVDLEAVHQHVISALCKMSEAFDRQIKSIQANNWLMPRVCIFEYDQSPMVKEGQHYKNKSVYNVSMD